MRIVFTGGGTGGHIVPLIAVTREIRKIYPEGKKPQFFYIGPKDEFGSVLLSLEGIKAKNVFAGKIRRYKGWKVFFQNFADVCFKIPLGILQSFFHIFFLFPDLIFSKGGFGSIPGVIAGKLLLTPVFLHESDITPGLANRFLGKFAMEIFVSFPRTEYFSRKKMILVGNPIRREVLKGTKEEAKELLKLELSKPVILILGGSQGAQRINNKILDILPALLENFEIIHQCGDRNFNRLKTEAKVMISEELEKFYHLFPFLKEPELRLAYAAADLIVSRSGSGSIFEIAASAKPAILVPLPESAQNHQVRNAYAYAENGACLVMEENNFTSRFFLEKLKYLFSNPEKLREMEEKTKEFARPYAARIIANYLLEYFLR